MRLAVPIIPLWLYGLTLFVGAALLFMVQPLVGRLLLPLVGGSPGGWLTALCFFQLALLAGYMLTHGLARLPAARHVAVILLLLLLGSFFLPVQVHGQNHPQSGAFMVLLWLAQALLLPFVALSMLTGGLQRLAAENYPADRVYRLYAVSNAGSLLGLLCYPLLIEPWLRLAVQQALWSYGYLLVAFLLLLILVPAPRQSTGSLPAAVSHPRLLWLVLAFIPSSLSLGMTALLSNEFGSIPIIWLLPLLLYLLSFIIAFSWRIPASVHLLGAFMLGLLILSGLMLLTEQWPRPLVMTFLLASFACAALYFHWRLSALRPDPQHLTVFYVWLALGGALGGLFNALLVPLFLGYPSEYAIVLTAAGLLVAGDNQIAQATRRLSMLSLVVVGGMTLVANFSTITQSYRNFYGTAIVQEGRWSDGELHRWIASGDGIQGSQQLTPNIVETPELYWTPIQPIMAFSRYRNIGMVGLGAGMALCFTAPERRFTVYEIDPKFISIARDRFTYLSSCGEPEWQLGDGRLLLAAHQDRRYDALIIDAFQGGHIPLHLITLEALQLYQSRVGRDGIILYNLNSLYYDLYPQLAAQAAASGWQIWRASDSWVLLARFDNDISWLGRHGWKLMVPRNIKVWRDDYANLLGALRIFSAP